MRMRLQETNTFREISGVLVRVIEDRDVMLFVMRSNVWMDRVEIAKNTGRHLEVSCELVFSCISRWIDGKIHQCFQLSGPS